MIAPVSQLEIRRRCTTAGPAVSEGLLILILASSATVSAAPCDVSRLGKLCHSIEYRPGARAMVNRSAASLGCKIRYSLPGRPARTRSSSGRYARLHLDQIHPLRKATGISHGTPGRLQRVQRDGFPSDGSGGTPPLKT